ncbi:MAG: flagellar export protein FliJ [Enterocloster bolteae]|uniref:flagellar export protein FliJ n=1 Tax=Enterocloster bolteae TaxID=208479 RepID=UPI003995B3ED
MKRFKYSLDTVLDYKTRCWMSSGRACGHCRNVMTKQERLSGEGKIKRIQEDLTRQNPRALHELPPLRYVYRQDGRNHQPGKGRAVFPESGKSKKKEVISAKVDTSKFEKLKDKRMQAYQRLR